MRHLPAHSLLSLGATTALLIASGCGGETPTGPETPPPPLVVTLNAPAKGAAVVLNGEGRCTFTLNAGATGGEAGSSASWEGGSLTWTAIATQQVTTEPLTPADVGSWFTATSLATGQTLSFSRTVSRARAFRVKHELRYRADGTSKTASHEFTCDFPPVASVALSSSTDTLKQGETTQLTATPRDSVGIELSGRILTWASSDTSIAAVSSAGVVSAAGAGTATITATSEDRSAAATITVLAPVATVTLSPTPLVLPTGSTATLTASLSDAQGNTLDRPVTWISANTAVATVSAAGVVTAVALGATTISASSEGKTSGAAVTVVPPVATVIVGPADPQVIAPQARQLTVVLRDAAGSTLTGRPVVWTTSDSTVAVVSDSGMLTGVTAGTATITAASEGKSGSLTATILPPIDSIEIAPIAPLVSRGRTMTLTATARDASGAALAGRTLTWTSGSSAIASVSASGVVTGVAVGTTTISVAAEGKTGTVELSVVEPVAFLSVLPNGGSVPALQSRQMMAVLRGAGGDTLTGRRVEWSSGNAGIATIDSTGLVTGKVPGTVMISATSEGISGATAFTVLPAAASVEVIPSPATVQVGDYVILEDTVRSATGAVLTGRATTWSSDSEAIARVDSSGTLTGVAVGTTTIRARVENAEGSVTVTVAPRQPVATLTVAPNVVTLPRDTAIAIAVTLRDAAGSLLLGRAVTWASTKPAVASVDSNGVVLGLTLGTAAITASSEGKIATAQVTVVPPIATIMLQPGRVQLLRDSSRTVTATLRDASGQLLTGRVITWETGSSDVATVTATGSTATVKGVGVGTTRLVASAEGKLAEVEVEVVAPVHAISVEPATARVSTGATLPLSAVLKDADGTTLTQRVVTWTSSNTARATVNANGVVSGIAIGAVTITATSEGRSGSASLTVSRPVNTVTLSPATATIAAGATQPVTVTLRDVNNQVLAGGTIAWTSSNPAVATVTSAGAVTGVSSGSATITATAEGKSGTMQVTVFMPVASVQFETSSARLSTRGTLSPPVTLRDASGAILTGRTVTWTSSDVAVAVVDAAGVITPVGPGTTTITATSEGVSGTLALTVVTPLAFVQVNPFGMELAAGGSATMTATPIGEQGDTLQGRGPVTWSSSDPSVATVTNGAVRAIRPGTTRVIAMIEDAVGTAVVEVTTSPLASIVLSPATATLPYGQTLALTPTFRDASGNAADAVPVTWSSDNANVAYVNTVGVVTSSRAGTAKITATGGGMTGTATITVPTPGPTARVEIDPSELSIVVGQRKWISGTAYDAHGVVLQGDFSRPSTWTSSNTSVATVDPNGYATGVSTGTSTIQLTVEGKSATMTLRVVPQGTPGTLTISPTVTSVMVGQTTNVTTSYRDVSGDQASVPTTVASSDPTIASVASNGTVTGHKVGTATITASAQGLTASAQVVVGRQPVYKLELSAGYATMTVGQSQQVSATVLDNTMSVVTDRPVTWVSTNPAIATVSSSGVITARALGNTTVGAVVEGKTEFVFVNVVSAVPTIANVVVSPSRFDMVYWDPHPRQLTVAVTDAAGRVVYGRPATWSSTNPAVASVSAGGLVTRVGAGSAEIRATVDGKVGVAYVNVDQRAISLLQLVGYWDIHVNESVAFHPLMNDASGNQLSPEGRTFTWRSTNTAVATVSAEGVVTGRSVGATEITVSAEGLTSQPYLVRVTDKTDPVVSITVAPTSITLEVDSTRDVGASYVTSSGLQYQGRGVTWTSSDPSVASVPLYGVTSEMYGHLPVGRVTAQKPGTATITATVGGRSASTSVTVTAPAPVGTVVVSPNPASVAVGNGDQLGLTLRDITGKVVGNRVVTWTSSNQAIVTVTNEGWIVGKALGTATVTAASEGKSGSATVSVVAAVVPVASVTVSPAPTTVAKGGTRQLTATVRDANGNTLTGRPVTWSTNAASVATVTGSGLVSGIAGGTATITATSGGKSGSSAVTVTTTTGGGGGGGGGGSGSVCSSTVSFTAPAKGTSTNWIRTHYDGLDFQVKSGTSNHGTGSAPKYQYTITWRNRYAQKIYFSMSGPSSTRPTQTGYAESGPANSTFGGNWEYQAPGTLWVYVAGVRFGSFSAPVVCE